MRRIALGATLSASVLFAALVFAQQPTGTSGSSGAVVFTPSEANWGPAPDMLPSGAQLAVIDGNPTASGPFTIRLKVPDGYKIAPHTHPTDENVTVIDGTFMLGMGNQYSEGSLKTLGAGGFAKMPQGMSHYASAKGETTIQIEGQGPFVLKYVNASDDPRNRK